MTRLSYAVVTPARNERANLERLAGSMVAQEHVPAAWVIVDDGSDDGTAELAASLTAEHAWIRIEGTGGDDGPVGQGRRRGRALDSFRAGVRRLSGELPDVIIKVDADTSFDPDYMLRLVERFALCPDLGIAGGACYEQEDGRWVRQKVIATHPRGASRAYRRECLDAVMTLESRMGWDGLDEVKARMRGYRSETVLDIGFRHHRATGGRESGRFGHFAAQGSAAWYMGYRPAYLALRVAYRVPKEPAAVGMLWGYARDAAARADRCPEPDVVRHLRDEQRLRAVVARGANP
jgi:glycosyltransferase involved in cell wall biosynthesis